MFQAVVLSIRQSGENNRAVTLLTETEGIITATLFGGPKSKLRSLVSQFNRGKIYLYRDESKRTCKITDFDVNSYHPSFNENLFKTYAASFAAEIIIKTRCAGSPSQSFYLYNGLLDGMELSDENNSRLGLIRFLWRYLGILGVRPSAALCCQCGKSFLTGKIGDDDIEWNVSYSESDNGFVCNDCLPINDGRLVLSRKSLTYLEATALLAPKDVRTIQIGTKTLIEMRNLSYTLIENACGVKLLSLQSGSGIL